MSSTQGCDSPHLHHHTNRNFPRSSHWCGGVPSLLLLTNKVLRISRRKKRPSQQDTGKQHRINRSIRVPEVRLIDENGDNHGVVATSKALAMAEDRGLDLVEVSPVAKPPVAKILNYNKLKYQEEKDRRREKAKQKKVEIKGVRISFRISDHDADVRLKQSEKFLAQGDKVKIEMILRGRERRHTDLAKANMQEFVDKLNERTPVIVEQDLNVQGGKLSILVANKS